MGKATLVSALSFVALVGIGGAAPAQEQCFARYSGIWELQNQGTLVARSGIACRIPLSTANASITSVDIVRPPSNGTASTLNSYSILFHPREGFRGQDSMVVHYSGNDGVGRPREATVIFAITVH
jgi:hypothetical protein